MVEYDAILSGHVRSQDWPTLISQAIAWLTANSNSSSSLIDELVALRSRAPTPDDDSSTHSVFLSRLSRLLYLNHQQRLLGLLQLPFPSYNYLTDFPENERAPWAPSLHERPVVSDRKWRLLGRDIGIPIGIPASVLTMNAEWIGYHAQNGFNILTYKTVRPRSRAHLSKPNWIFISHPQEPIRPKDINDTAAIGDIDTWPMDASRFSTANSFGVPSKDPTEWIEDVKAALRRMAPDQLLILSVMGSFEEVRGDDLVEDFAEAARLASHTGVSVVELNLSCPNGVVGGHPLPPVCEDAEMVAKIVERTRSVLDPSISLVAKFSYLGLADLRRTLSGIADVVDGVSGINTLQVPVKMPSDPQADAFPGRDEAGISGYVIRDLALDFVKSTVEIRGDLGATFDIIGMGGVMTGEDAVKLYAAGASAVQSASGAFFNPTLAQDLVERFGTTFPRHEFAELGNSDSAQDRVLEVLTSSVPLTLADIAARSRYGPSLVRLVIERLVREGQVRRVTERSLLTSLFARAT